MSFQEFRPLYLANDLAKEAGYEITYAYDDLVFIAHSEILLQFPPTGNNSLILFTHIDLDPETEEKALAKLARAATATGVTLISGGRFSMSPKEDSKEIDLRFFPAPETV